MPPIHFSLKFKDPDKGIAHGIHSSPLLWQSTSLRGWGEWSPWGQNKPLGLLLRKRNTPLHIVLHLHNMWCLRCMHRMSMCRSNTVRMSDIVRYARNTVSEKSVRKYGSYSNLCLTPLASPLLQCTLQRRYSDPSTFRPVFSLLSCCFIICWFFLLPLPSPLFSSAILIKG